MMVWFLMFFEDSVSAVRALATGEAFPWGVELSDESRGGDETRHRYQTHSEWHTDSKVCRIVKSGLPNKYYRKQVL